MTNLNMQRSIEATPDAPTPGAPRRGGRGRAKVAGIVAACAVVVGGGAFAATGALSGPGGQGASAATAVSSNGAVSPNGAAGQAAVLSDILSDAAPAATSATSATAQSAATTAAAKRRLHGVVARIRRVGGEHGELTLKAKSGTRTLAFERGTVTAATAASVTVRAADGTTWSWTLNGTSVVREDGTRKAASTLAKGQHVFTGGQVSGSTRDARLVVIAKG
ncbi:MAG TPA: hypothetical protein VH478_00925 [Trebonia sp.]|jgi:hypothetical protein|nr:hypothetical protein [Trebonia sp.]